MPKKDQFVIAYLADLENCQAVVEYAKKLAAFLKKGIILLYICDRRYTKRTQQEALERVLEIENKMAAQDVRHCVLSGKTKEIINVLPTLLNGVVCVAGVDRHARLFSPTRPFNVIHDFAQCKIAYLTVQAISPEGEAFGDVALRIDYLKESKEKLIWSSYFARFNKSRLHVLHENYRDAGLKNKYGNNMLFLQKFYASVCIGYEEHVIPSVANFQDMSAVKYAAENGYGLAICLTTDTRERDILDWFIGAQEYRVVRNKYKLPILFLNPRDDLYVLCD